MKVICPTVILTVAVASGACDTGTGPGDNPEPALTALSPDSVVLGSQPPLLTVTGAGFVPTSHVEIDGTPRATLYVNSTTMTAPLTDADLSVAGALSVTVVSDTPGGGTSPQLPLVIYEAAPVVRGLEPAFAAVGQLNQVLTVLGNRFRPGAVIQWDGVDRSTIFVNDTRIQTWIGAAELSTAGQHTVGVRQGAFPVDTILQFNVVNPRPTVESLTPPFTAAGRVDLTLAIDGTGFMPGAIVHWNDAPRPTTFVSPTRLTAQIPDADVAASGTATIKVVNPQPAVGPSTAVTFSIHPAGRHNLDLDAADVIWDPVRNLLYASVLDSDLRYPNRVVAIDPMSGEVVRSVIVGSMPKRLALADDASVLYVALDGAGSIRPIDLATFNARPAFYVGERGGKILYANDIEVMPGHPGTIAVTQYVHGDWTGEGPIAEVMIFDDGVARALSTWSGNMIEFTAPDTLYGVGEGGYARIGVIRMVVTDSGAVWDVSVSDLFGIDGGDFDYGNGSLFTAGGGVIDVPQITARTPLALGGNVGVDRNTGRVFYMVDTTLSVIDGSTLQLIGTEIVHGMPPIYAPLFAPRPLIRWGSDGLAYRAYGRLVIFRTSLAVP